MGLPMMWYFINGGQLFDLSRDVTFFPCLFESHGYFLQQFRKIAAAVKGKAKQKIRCNTITEKYLWRPEKTRHLRAEQFVRYFSMSNKHAAIQDEGTKAAPTRGFTKQWREVHDLADDVRHPKYDAKCAAMRPGTVIAFDQKDCTPMSLTKRSTRA